MGLHRERTRALKAGRQRMLKPISEKAWNGERAAHLLNRAGFGGSPAEVAALSRRGPRAAVEKLVDYRKTSEAFSPPSWIVPGIEERRRGGKLKGLTAEKRRMIRKEASKQKKERLRDLRQWWLRRMLGTSRPLQEKLTLFWHGHFATSYTKVKSAYAMYLQNMTLRDNANGNFATLVTELAKDPAMLVYLDNAKSRKGNPNENFARELMELFTMGEGNYTESDIKAVARAFTGWTLDRDSYMFSFRKKWHDRDIKTIFGTSGNFGGADVISLITARPATARFIARKLWEYFAYPGPDATVVEALAEVLRGANYELKPLLRTILLSEEFYAKRALRTQVKSPVQYLVQSVTQLGTDLPSAEQSQRILRGMGQELFAPPNVKGWDGGYSWITSSTIGARNRLAKLLVYGKASRKKQRGRQPAAGAAILVPVTGRKSADAIRRDLQWRLFQSDLRWRDRRAFRKFVESSSSDGGWSDRGILDVTYKMMTHTQYQLT